MLSRDLRSQVSPLCPEEEIQMVKIRSPLTPQGEEVRITARMGGPQHYDHASQQPETQCLNHGQQHYVLFFCLPLSSPHAAGRRQIECVKQKLHLPWRQLFKSATDLNYISGYVNAVRSWIKNTKSLEVPLVLPMNFDGMVHSESKFQSQKRKKIKSRTKRRGGDTNKCNVRVRKWKKW